VNCLSGSSHPAHKCQKLETRVRFPPVGVPKTWCLLVHHKDCRRKLTGSKLAYQRHRFLQVFCAELKQAFMLMNQKRPDGTTMDLHQPLEHLLNVLGSLSRVKDYDDIHPVLYREIPAETLVLDNESPTAVWLKIKLGYTRMGLVLLVPIFCCILPDNIASLGEVVESLESPQWQSSFVFDTKRSRDRLDLFEEPRLQDVYAQRLPGWFRTASK
jgi:hypothetical protein